ncbi:MAG: TetR/AcrR family transcriptional regulator [Acutalibacteraceae bacterium]
MAKNTKNKSVLKTDKALRRAFCEFLREDGYYVPTVQQLTDRAEISKTTFYRRYKNMDDFIENEINFAVCSVCDNVQWFERALEDKTVTSKEVVADMKENDTTVQLIHTLVHSQFIYDYSKRLMREIYRLSNEKEYVKAMSPQEKEKYFLYISVILSGCYMNYPKNSFNVFFDYIRSSRKILFPSDS